MQVIFCNHLGILKLLVVLFVIVIMMTFLFKLNIFDKNSF